MPPRRRIPVAAGLAAVREWETQDGDVGREPLARAVRYTLEELGERAQGRSTEVRVPPFGVVQCIEGTTHRRGTPPNVIETDAETWLAVATGRMSWTSAWESGRLLVSGTRADLTTYLPLVDPSPRAQEGDLT